MEIRSASRRAFTALLVCLTLCVSSPLQGGEEAGVWGDDVTAFLEVGGGGDGGVAAAMEMVRADKDAATHIEDAERAFHGAVPQEKPKELPPQPEQTAQAEKAKADEREAKAAAQQLAKPAAKDNHDATWHCDHCASSCTTAKCKSWCEKSWCKQNSPLFEDTALKVPAGADNQWHCAHCKGVCKTNKCNSWCKKMWCPMDADGNAFYGGRHGDDRYYNGGRKGRHGSGAKVHGGKGKMKLLEISKHGSPKLTDMERNANKMITLSNQDIKGTMLRAAANAVDSVLNQRELERDQFKERENKANEADKKRYDKEKYQKWQNEEDGSDGVAAEQQVTEAKERTQKDNSKEIKFKTEADQGEEATKDLDKKIDDENKKFEEQEKVKKEAADQINKDHKDMVSPNQAVFHMKNPSF